MTLVNRKMGVAVEFNWYLFLLCPTHFSIIFPTVEFPFNHFSGLPTDLQIRSQVPGLMLKVLYDLASRILPDNVHHVLSWHTAIQPNRTGYSPLKYLSLPHFRPLPRLFPLPECTHHLLFQLQLLCQLSHEVFLAHASRRSSFILSTLAPTIFCPLAFKFFQLES